VIITEIYRNSMIIYWCTHSSKDLLAEGIRKVQIYGFVQYLNDKIYVGLVWFAVSWSIRTLCLFIGDFPRSLASEKQHCYLSQSSTSDWITMEILRNIAWPRALKLQFAWNFTMAVLWSREHDTLKLSGYTGDDKFRNLREYKRNNELCIAEFY